LAPRLQQRCGNQQGEPAREEAGCINSPAKAMHVEATSLVVCWVGFWLGPYCCPGVLLMASEAVGYAIEARPHRRRERRQAQ
jgi:hypothetical protein